ncbi:MAG: DMT family transporter [Candidatus Omnitrophica bacterium]|nr:DMT family transporter [Candidatus Omnitrophota bacterium]
MLSTSITNSMLGCLTALISAASWAFGSILFRKLGDKATPLAMNFVKGIIGTVYLLVVISFLGFEKTDAQTILLLSASGLLGIALGDTLFFKALIYLGPRLTILLSTLGPVFTITLAIIFLRERPSFLAWIGMFLTTSGILWVLWERAPREEAKNNWKPGVKFAILSAACMSLGIIFAKLGVVTSSAIQATLIRISASFVSLGFWGILTHSLDKWIAPFKSKKMLGLIALAVFVAIFGGFWMFLLALKYIDASIATILSSTTPLFILPMSAFFLKERISARAILGACVAVSGVVLIFLA